MFTAQKNRKIPLLMGTQHPDNASVPFCAESAFISRGQEMEEIFQNFFELGCDEFMWDWEGKFADEAMIEKLLSVHLKPFQQEELGRDRFITLRVPNVWEEKTFKLARAYMSVLSASEFVNALGLNTPPVFEFILPMTTRADQLIHIQSTFRKMAKVHEEIFGSQNFGDGYIHIIPLIESVEDFAGAYTLLENFLILHKKEFGCYPPYMRVFIARSDPALNAGLVPAVLGSRLALREFYRIQNDFGIPIYPIIGAGSLPFRGGINPDNIERSLQQYKGCKTITVQSAFRYDYPVDQVKSAMKKIEEAFAEPEEIKYSDEEFAKVLELCDIFKKFYRPTIEKFSTMINQMAESVPSRRERVQHNGLFGYNRGVGEVSLPRAIKFTAACYSLGVPPEFIGTGRGLKVAKEKGLIPTLEDHFFTLRHELKHAGKFLNRENLAHYAKTEEWAQEIEEDIKLCEEILDIELGPDKDQHFLHRNVTSNIALKQRIGKDFSEDLVEAAILRKSLG